MDIIVDMKQVVSGDIVNQLSSIKDYLKTHRYTYIDIPDTSVSNIHALLLNHIYFEPSCRIDMVYIGVYYFNRENMT